MFYLHVKTRSRPAEEVKRLASIHGPFATPQEARGFFVKLQLWYPITMQQAEYEVVEDPPRLPN